MSNLDNSLRITAYSSFPPDRSRTREEVHLSSHINENINTKKTREEVADVYPKYKLKTGDDSRNSVTVAIPVLLFVLFVVPIN